MSGRHKRLSGARGADRRTFSLMVHGAEFGAGEELVINPDCFPDVKVNDLVEISQPERDHHRLVLQVLSLNAVRGKLQISILKDVAAQFGLDAFHPVVVQKVDPRDVTVDYMELTFRDQFVSRADIWRVKVAMFGKCVYIGKHVATLGVRSQVEALLSSNQNVMCGVVGADTKMIVRSRSSRLIWLVQMSTEMWEFAPDGELYYEKMLNRLLKVLVNKWTEYSVSHSVTIIAFSRSYYDKNQFPDDYNPTSTPFRDAFRQGFGLGCAFADSANGYGPAVHVDPVSGQYYEDFYKVVVMNYTGPDWGHLLKLLKEEFTQYHEKHRWRTADEFIRAEYEICNAGTHAGTLDKNESGLDGGTYVKWKSLPYGVPSRAVNGNILEAINVTLNILDKHFMDRDLNRTGQSIVMLTAGSSVFRVDEQLVEVTKQRMMDNGVGMDMISLATPPLHVVPLFICRSNRSPKPSSPGASALGTRSSFRSAIVRSPSTALFHASQEGPDHDKTSNSNPCTDGTSLRTFYIVPHWVNITFLEFDCQCASQVTSNSSNAFRQANKKLMSHRLYMCECQSRLNGMFAPLPPFRMFDITAPTDTLAFPVALANMMKCRKLQEDRGSTNGNDNRDAPGHDSPRRRFSNLSDAISTASPNASTDQWSLCRSPDFVVSRSPRLESYASVGFTTSLMAREALEEYDADVFTPMTWKKSSHYGISPSAFDDENDLASMSLTGDMLSLINAKANNRWKSVSSHATLGSSSLVHSILSPRNSMPQSRSSSSVNRQIPGLSPHVGPMKRDISTQSLTAFALDTANQQPLSQLKVLPRNDAGTSVNRSSIPKQSPPLAPVTHSTRGTSTAPTDIVRASAVKSCAVDAHHGSDVPEAAVEGESTVPCARSLTRTFRSPPLPASTLATLLPSPMELSGSYNKKSFLTGNGMPPAMRRTESDQASTTPLVGSYHINGADLGPSPMYLPSLQEVNPFRYSSETLESTAARITSDRRRWSHLFPVMNNPTTTSSLLTRDNDKQTHLGPNWKSLTSPAILPLTTDYHPSPKDLYTSYTESFYALTLPSTDGDLFPKYNSHDELLIEMICQRLASDFQLVTQGAGVEVDVVRNGLLPGTSKRGPSGESQDKSATYYLSMGHRIHQIVYDAELQAIEVKRYVDRTSQGQHNEPIVYKYSLWVDRTQSFHPLQQNFYQYPMPEDNWNALDHLLCGYHDKMSDMIKYRRIRFTVLPPAGVVTGSRADKEAYALRFTKFVDYLQTRVASEHGAQEMIRIKVSLDPLPSPNLQQQIGALSYKMSCESMASYTRLKSEDPRNEWLMMHVEDTMQVDKSYHFDVRWLACSGIIVDDFISTIRRKAKQAGLELRRIPEYTSVSFLQIHPLIAPIFLPMPLEIMADSDREKALVKVLVNRLEFILDDEKLAESRGIGYGLGIGKEEKPSQDASSKVGVRFQRRVRSKEEIEAQLLEKWRKRGYKQYIHRQAPVFLRLIHNGVVWIPSYDYDQISTPEQADALFNEICGLIRASATCHDFVGSSCSTEAA